MEETIDLRTLPGLVATVVLGGTVEAQYADCREELRVFNERNGFTKVEYKTFPATLVESGRDAVCAHALQAGYSWVLQIDADAVFPPDTMVRLLTDAFVRVPDSDAVGAYCQLKQPPTYVCTIDTGSGTWEEHYPGEGILPVIRTGAHCILVKTSALRKFGPPWFRTRLAMRPVDALAEVDNFARISLSGRNPFRALPEWDELVQKARAVSGSGPGSVGEDSGFCDALVAAGGRIYVDTDIVTGHITRDVIGPHKLREAFQQQEKGILAAHGVIA